MKLLHNYFLILIFYNIFATIILCFKDVKFYYSEYIVLTKSNSVYKSKVNGYMDVVNLNKIFNETGLMKLNQNQHDVSNYLISK